MKAQLQTLIPSAIQAIRDVGIPERDGAVKKIYHGYISSLGAGIVQAGLLPAVIFFENSQGEEEEGKVRVCQAIRLMAERAANPNARPGSPESYRLSQYILDGNLQHDSQFLSKVNTYAVALKIAMRTFKKI